MARLTDPILEHLKSVLAEGPLERADEVSGDTMDDRFGVPLGTVAGRFDVQERLGEGGMGTVYRAHDRDLGREVALKILNHGDTLAEKRFDREISALEELAHPGIVGYVAHGGRGARDGPDPPFVAMELLDGENLAVRLARAPLGLDEALRVGLELASALSAAHAVGLVHRDVKPSNVILCRDGSVRLVDFGLARSVGDEQALTRDGYTAGTLGYMSPEQARGQRDVDARADVFALGCVLREALGGAAARDLRDVLIPRPPLRAEKPDAPEALEALLLEMMAPNPAVRLPHGGVVLRRLRALTRFPGLDPLRPEPGHGWAARVFGQRAALHGRDAERAWLRELGATPGAGCLVVGEAGVGKTRLALEAVGADWAYVAADPAGASRPLAFLARLVGAAAGVVPGDRGVDRHRKVARCVARALPDPAAADALGRLAWAGEDVTRGAAAGAFVAWCAAAWDEAPWSVVLDDLDLADAASVDVLAAALAASPARPRVVALARPSIEARHPGLGERLGLTGVRLGGVGASALDALADDLLGRGGAALLGATRGLGSPLHAEEELRAHALGIAPPSPDAAVARVGAKIAALGPYARWCLRAATLFGDAFAEHDLAALLGQGDAPATRRALIELALSDVVVAVEGESPTFRIRTRLDAEVARSLMTPGDATLGARVVAQLLGAAPA